MVKLSPKAQALLAARKRQYIASLPTMAEHLEQLTNPENQPQPKALHTLLHQLAGSSGLYGLDEIQSLAAKLNQLTNESPEYQTLTGQLIELLKNPAS